MVGAVWYPATRLHIEVATTRNLRNACITPRHCLVFATPGVYHDGYGARNRWRTVTVGYICKHDRNNDRTAMETHRWCDTYAITLCSALLRTGPGLLSVNRHHCGAECFRYHTKTSMVPLISSDGTPYCRLKSAHVAWAALISNRSWF